MRVLLLLVALLAWTGASQASTVRIVEYGIYAIEFDGTRRPSDSDPTGYQQTYVAARNKEQTDSICARLGITFGYRYTVTDGSRGGSVPVTTIVRYPEPGITNARKVKFNMAEYKEQVALGTPASFFYTFDEPWEMVAGVWKLEVHLNGRLMAEQTFLVSTACGIS